jgi:hypothetical protein
MLPDGVICVRLPESDDLAAGRPDTESPTKNGWNLDDLIPRRPERPSDYDAYRYPVPCEHDCAARSSGRDRRSGFQPGGSSPGIDLPRPSGTPVRLVALDHQEGDARIVFAGTREGTTGTAVVTSHPVREGQELREYLVILDHLDRLAPGLSAQGSAREGALLGFTGPSGHSLYLETRRLRSGVDVAALSPEALVSDASSVGTDPRNVLSLKQSALPEQGPERRDPVPSTVAPR